MVYPFFNLFITYGSLGSGLDDCTWLVIQFVIYFWTIYNYFTKFVPEKIWIEFSFVHFHVFDLMDSAEDTKAELGVIRVVNEILCVQYAWGDIVYTKAYQFTIDAVLVMNSAIARIGTKKICFMKFTYIQMR